MNLMDSTIRSALIQAAHLLFRPEIAQLIESVPNPNIADDGEDHDFSDAPRTKNYVAKHPLPKFSPDADCINGLVKLACEIERSLKKEG